VYGEQELSVGCSGYTQNKGYSCQQNATEENTLQGPYPEFIDSGYMKVVSCESFVSVGFTLRRLVTIYVRGYVQLRDGRIKSMENINDPIGNRTQISRIVAQCVNQLRHPVCHLNRDRKLSNTTEEQME
jgi:hypothetical protein